ncbi:MAG: hypothetical protein MUF18_03095 [Fimbriiglobus sp.]|nr:hypothetical protein [Fimbriiglobus sp.]
MIQIAFRVVLALVWLTVGVGFLFRALLPQGVFEGRDGLTLNLFGMIALVLAGYNVMRLVAVVRRRQALARLEANPLARPTARPREYIPELDFTKPDPTKSDETK